METVCDNEDSLVQIYEQMQTKKQRSRDLRQIAYKLDKERKQLPADVQPSKLKELAEITRAYCTLDREVSRLEMEYRRMMPDIIDLRLSILIDALFTGGWQAHEIHLPRPAEIKKLAQNVKLRKRRLKNKD